jgi:hypothetical protein
VAAGRCEAMGSGLSLKTMNDGPRWRALAGLCAELGAVRSLRWQSAHTPVNLHA